MDSKILPLNVIPDHPRFLRLPSLSRSLVHSILPKACQAMHNKPLIFSVSPCSISLPGPPKLSERTRKKHKSISNPIQKSYNTRPFSPSYTYKKMFIQKPSTPLPKFKHARLKKYSENKEKTSKSYYCEITALATKKSRENSPLASKFGKTLYDFKSNFGTIGKKNGVNLDASEQCHIEAHDEAQGKVLMKNISEVRSSLESSNESLDYLHLKNVAT